MTDSMLRVGMIGCGGVSALHAGAWAKLEGAKVVCCADVDEAKAKDFATKNKVPRYVTDYKELLKSKEVDLVDVCVPTFAHAEAVVAAAHNGKHALCEKPIAMTIKDADRMIRATSEAGVKFMIAFPRRFDTQLLKVKELICSGAIGRPVIMRSMDGDSGPVPPFYLDAKRGGGPFVSRHVHDYDIARFIFGEPAWATACLVTFKPDSDALDTGTAIVGFESGDQLVVSNSWGLPGRGHDKCRAASARDVIGSGGVIHFPTPQPNEEAHLLLALKDKETRKEPYAAEPVSAMFDREIAHFAQCVRENKEPCVTGRDGKRALEIALAVLKSGKTGKRVSLRE